MTTPEIMIPSFELQPWQIIVIAIIAYFVCGTITAVIGAKIWGLGPTNPPPALVAMVWPVIIPCLIFVGIIWFISENWNRLIYWLSGDKY